MVRASVSGKFDFSKFDPDDVLAWRRLAWTLDEIELDQARETSKLDALRWSSLLTVQNLSKDSFENAQTQITSSVNRYLKAAYPWLKDQIGEDGKHTAREQLQSEYYERYGKPGEEQYEQMVVDLRKELRRKLTPMEKMRERQLRRLRRAG